MSRNKISFQDVANEYANRLFAKLNPIVPVLLYGLPNQKAGNVISICERGITLKQPLQGRNLEECSPTTVDFQLCMECFAERFVVPIVDQLVKSITTDLIGYKEFLMFGKLYVPCGIRNVAIAEYYGCWVRLVQAYDINTDSFPMRADVLYGGI